MQNKSIDHEWVAMQRLVNEKHPVVRVAKNAITKNGVEKATMSHSVVSKYDHATFAHRIEREGACTAQKSSGRCWIFACLNVMRVEMMRKFADESIGQLDSDFELSQTYLFFFDKLERSNFFLESIIETCEEPLEGRLVSHLLSNDTLMSDGGQWDMLVGIIQKYGVVPKKVYPDTHASTLSRPMNLFLRSKLRKFAAKLRSLAPDKNAMRKAKVKMMEAIYQSLVIFLGQPPVKFDFVCPAAKRKGGAKEATDQDAKITADSKTNASTDVPKTVRMKDLTPLAFYKNVVPVDVVSRVSLIHDPRNDFFKLYTVQWLGNVVGGPEVRYINVPIDMMKDCAARVIRDEGSPVWFGCDVGKHKDNDLGVMCTRLRDLDSAFPALAGVSLTKEERLRYGHSLMTHAMVFTAFDTDGNGDDASSKTKYTKWRVENSWGTSRGCKGYYFMSDAWFDEYVFQIVVDKKVVPERALAALSTKPIVLPPWDPMGSLAA